MNRGLSCAALSLAAFLLAFTLPAAAQLHWYADPTVSFRTVTHTENTKHLGFGFQWWLTRQWAVRAEYERFYSIGKPFAVGGTGTTGEADVDAAWLGFVARF